MSHFTVLVIGEDPEDQMAPFQENNMGDCPQEYMDFNDQEDEWRHEYETGSTERVIMPDGRMLAPWDNEFRNTEEPLSSPEPPEDLERRQVPFKKMFATFGEYMDGWHGMESPDQETGKYGYWHNPNCQWDWFVMGGRWKGVFMLRNGCSGVEGQSGAFGNEAQNEGWVDQARKGDIDWEMMRQAHEVALEKEWEGAKETEDGLKKIGIFSGPMTKEEYFNKHINFSTFAVLKDGKWYENGNMGWWGIVTDEKEPDTWQDEFDKLIQELPNDTLLTVFDCHI